MKTFVMGDVHGAFPKLVQCLRRSAFDYERDRLVQLGDITDRGDMVKECVDELLKIRNLVAIRGNHDDWFNRFLLEGSHPFLWEEGGEATARSYLRPLGRQRNIIKKAMGYKTTLSPGQVPESHRLFFAGQHNYFIDEANNCFVHGGFDRYHPFRGQQPEVYFWDRELWTEALYHELWNVVYGRKQEFYMATPFNHVFIGHTPTLNWEQDTPMQAVNIFNLDTGAGRKEGRLTIMDVETKAFWQSDALV